MFTSILVWFIILMVVIIIIMKCVFFFSLFIFSTRTQNCVNPSFSYIFCVFQKGVHCRGGQTYQVCANSCARTCYDIALYPKCRKKCVEGCNCPEGQTLDPFGLCIPIHECPCIHKGIEYQPGHKELRPGARSPDLWYTGLSFSSSCRDL